MGGCLADPGPHGWRVLLQARDKVLLALSSWLTARWLWQCLLGVCCVPAGVLGSGDAAPSAQIHFCPHRSQALWRLEQETDKVKAEKGETYQEVVSVDQYIGLVINHLGFCITSYRKIQTNIYPTHYKAGAGDVLCGGVLVREMPLRTEVKT